MSKDNKIDQELVRQLAVILNETDLTEIEVEQGDLHIRVARNITMSVAAPAAQPAMAAPAMQAAPTATAEAPQAPESKGHVVKSPMVGTAYLAPEPGADEFVKVGDTVTAGQTILIVEAMKHMNQISADRAGKVTEIFVESGQPVEYGEPLLTLE